MLVRVFFFLLLLTINLHAKDSSEESNSLNPHCYTPNNFDNGNDLIQIKILKNKSWIENLFNLMIEFNESEINKEHRNVSNFNISDKYKKFFKSKIKIISKKNNIDCEFDAKIKLMGDTMWHFEFVNGMPYSSMHVKLIDGHIKNKTNFRLLMPISRNNDNEIFIVSILRYLGFVAPETFYTNVKINGNVKKYIFQEDLQKELLESFSLVEGPIIEGDERFTNKKKFNGKNFRELSLSRISNAKYVKDDFVKIKKSLEAITLMNQIYIHSHLSQTNNIELLRINKKFFDDNKFYKKFDIYESLIYAMYSSHGQSHDDRRFYFDPINNYFVPIYYDGKSRILDEINSKDKINEMEMIVSTSAKKGAGDAIKLLASVDDEIIINILKKNGLSLKKEQYLKIKNKILNRLNTIKDLNPKKIKFLEEEQYFKRFEKYKDKLRLVFANNNEIKICDLLLNDCKKIEIEKNEIFILKNLISQNFSYLKKKSLFFNDKIYLFVGTNINYKKDVKINKFSEIKVNKNFSLSYNNNIKPNIDLEKKIITINQTGGNGRAIISGKKISDWQINFYGNKDKENKLLKKNYQNLTGCLTFVDIKLENVNFYADNSKCEDAINLIRTEGKIKNVEIFNSEHDALDLDFSSLQIDKIKVNESLNDCLDVSFGKYKIIESVLKGCGDKGISVGEKSIADLDIVKISHVKTGVSSKDSSITKINNSQISNANTCVSAYKKKQEFGGSLLNIKNLNCINYKEKINEDLYSKVNINNLTH